MDFADLYGRYAQDVFRFAYYLSANRELADDITAETFTRALTARASVAAGSVKAYLFSIARNLFLDSVRARGRTTPLATEHLDAIDPTPTPETIAAGRLDLEAIRGALQQLPEGERAALLMSTIDGMPYEQIGAALGCSVAAVKLRVHRARLHLRHLTAERSKPS
jgi:RNA polymerase sigma-70 factor (ECF subfamily)